MKLRQVYIFFLFAFIATSSVAQSVDFELLSYNGLPFYSSKTDIIQKLGKPQKVYEPKYDCGFLSADEQGQTFITLDYGTFKFTGNQKEKYLLEAIDFDKDHSIIVTYGNHNLSHKTTLSKLMKIFGDNIGEGFGERIDGSILILNDTRDDGIMIWLLDGKLTRLEYWSSC